MVQCTVVHDATIAHHTKSILWFSIMYSVRTQNAIVHCAKKSSKFVPLLRTFRYNGAKYTAHGMHIHWDNSIFNSISQNFLPTNWAQSNSWTLPSIKIDLEAGSHWADHFTMAWKNQPWWTEYIYLYLDIHIYLQELFQTNKDSSIVMGKRERRNEIIDTLT